MSITSNAPYFDKYDSKNQYTQLLAIPGRVAQAREFTEMQSTMKDIIKSIGDSLLRDGNIIEGCQVIVSPDKKSIIVTEGKVYISGMVLPVKTTEDILIKGEGVEYIGVKLKERVVDELEDPTLLDPAQGYGDTTLPGCNRLKSEVEVVLNDSDASTITKLIDGEIALENYAPAYDTMTQTLARRTFDESGSYIVEGLNVRVEEDTTEIDPETGKSPNYTIVVEAGKAYVLGYELRIPAARRLIVPRSTSTISINKSDTYKEGIDKYLLDAAPYVRNITKVTGKQEAEYDSSVSSESESIRLPEDFTDQEDIISVIQNGVEFSKDVDYEISSISGAGNRFQIVWLSGGNKPQTNVQITITYYKTVTFLNNVDYRLYHDEDTDSHYIQWISGNKPAVDTRFYVSYDQYLARKDVVYIDQYGDISVSLGIAANYGYEVLPDAPVNTLPLAYIMSPPGGKVSNNENLKIVVSNIGLTRFTMNDIHQLLNRIKTIEYDQAVISLNNEAKEQYTENDKKGLFTEPFIDVSKIDFSYNATYGEDNYKFNSCIDLDTSMCYLPVKSMTYDLVPDSSISNVHTYKRTATLKKKGESIVLSQMSATKSFPVNPYTQFPQLPEISIDPAVDAWIDENIVQVKKSIKSSQVVSMSSNTFAGSQRVSGRFDTFSDSSTSTIDTVVGTKVSVSTSEKVIKEEPITYMREKTINVEAEHFASDVDVICYFDGQKLPLTSKEGWSSGVVDGSVRTDELGSLKASFNIPGSTFLTGIREVRLEATTNVAGYHNSAVALYQAIGTLRTIKRTVTTLTTVLINRVVNTTVTTYIDPVGQTFVLNKPSLISAIDLYFESKPTSSNTPVTCEIREVANGLITSTVYGHSTLPATAVNEDKNKDSTVPTRFKFEDPVFLEENKEYAFVVRTTSSSYRLWVAELGETDVQTGETVLSNPYLLGVMMSSSNNSSWTVHQTTDIKFSLISDTYESVSEIYFKNVVEDADKFSRLYLLAESIVPSGTTLDWYYKTETDTVFKPLSVYNQLSLNGLYKNLDLKAVLSKTPESNMSPILALDSVATILSRYEKSGYYITKNISGLDPFTHIDVYLDLYKPNDNTSIKVLTSINGEEPIQLEDKEKDRRFKNYNWVEHHFQVDKPAESLDKPNNSCRMFIKLDSDKEYYTPAFRRLRVIMS